MTVLGPDVFRQRRKLLSREIDGGLLVISAYDLMQQSADMPHPFRQEANFLYLTGLNEPSWLLIYDGTRDRSWIVRPERTDVEKLFGGELSDEQALAICGANEVIAEAELDMTLRQMKLKHSSVWTMKHSRESYNFQMNLSARRLVSRLERIFTGVNSVERELSDIRAVKQPEEVNLIKKAIAITASAFSEVQRNILSYDYEYEIEAEFWSQFRRKNAVHAYGPIIASGANATTLHYEHNNSRVVKRSLLLMDCGASVEGYNADITRTIAVGQISAEQTNMYDVLLAAQKQVIKSIKPGLSFTNYQRDSDDIMKKALQALGLLERYEDETTYRKYLPHAVSHGLGIDVHESLGSSGYFKPGMVLTVEPGIYVAEKGIGIRIEDNILVTQTGRQNLSRAISTELR